MAVNPSALGPKPQFEVASGTPAVGNRLFMYVAGSVGTKQNTYTTSTGATPNTNPVVLDSLGFPTTTEIWWTAGQSYKVVYAPPGSDDPPNSPIWTIDNLRGINDTTSTFDEWIPGPTPTFLSATSFSLVGDQTGVFQAGRRVKTTNTGGTVYSTIITSAFAAVTTVTVVNDSGVLDSGLSAVSYALMSFANASVRGGLYLLDTKIASSSATLDFTSGINSAFDEYELRYSFTPANNGVQLIFRLSQNGGSTYKAGTEYAWTLNETDNSPLNTPTGSAATSGIALSNSGSVSNTSTNSINGIVKFWNPSSTTLNKMFKTEASHINAAAAILHSLTGTGVYNGDQAAFNAVRLLFTAGNIATGWANLYGFRKS